MNRTVRHRQPKQSQLSAIAIRWYTLGQSERERDRDRESERERALGSAGRGVCSARGWVGERDFEGVEG